MKVKTPTMLVLTLVFALFLCGAVSAGTPLQENQTGTVSGDLYVNTTDGWPSSTQGATNEVTQTNTLPAYTSIDSAWVYVNVYSGSGTNNWPVRTTIKLDGNGDGDYDDAGELLGVEDMNIPGTTDGTVYWLNDHCNRVYSDYQVWYNVTNLITTNHPTLYVKTENMGGADYDGRIKLLALCVAYNDGDTDKVDYWVLNGQDWINADTSPSTSTFNTSSFNGQVSNATLNTVALTSTDGNYTLNGNNLSGNLTETGSYYKEHQWDVTSNINAGANTNLTYTNVGSSFKSVLATLTIREALMAPVADFMVNTTSGLAPLTVQFTSNSTGAITSYAWDFDNDGTTDSTEVNPTWTYTTPGKYTVKLTATGPLGSADETKSDYIIVRDPTVTDLEVTNLISDSLNIDKTGNVTVRVENLGGVASSAFTVLLYADWSPITTYAADYGAIQSALTNPEYTGLLGKYNISSLAPGNFIDLVFNWTPDEAGVHVLKAVIDTGNSEEANHQMVVVGPYTGTVTILNPGDNVASVLQAAKSGDTVFLNPGTYDASSWGQYTWTAAQNDVILKGMGADLVKLDMNGTGGLRIWASTGTDNHKVIDGVTFLNGGTSLDGGTTLYISTYNTVIRNCIFENCKQIFEESGSIFEGNVFSNCTRVYLKSSGGKIQGCVLDNLTNNGENLYSPYATDNLLLNCTGSSRNLGGPNSSDVTLKGNKLINCILTSTAVTASHITVSRSASAVVATLIEDNLVVENSSKNGLFIYNVKNGTITDNTFENCLNGIYVRGSANNIIYLNEFKNCTTTVAYYDATIPVNTWNSTETKPYIYNGSVYLSIIGNYWSDYTGVDANGDGIGDTPYTIPGSGGQTDNYPLITTLDQYNFDVVQADFTADIVSGIVPLQVQFTDQSQGTVTSYAWDFNSDGIVDSTEKNPIWTYNKPGNYTVKLTVSNSSGSDDEIKTDYITVIADTEAPTVIADPTGGTYTSLVQVTLNATDNSGYKPAIYYTTNGDDPTTNSTPYTVPISIPATVTLKFIAVDVNGNVSPVRSETYTINDSEAPAVSASPAGGTYTSKTEVALTATDNVDPSPVIYYTLDGSAPTTNSTRYSGPFYIPANFTNTLKFFAVDASGNTSPVQTETYTLVPDLSGSVSVTNYPISQNKATVTVNNSDAADTGAFNVTVQINGNSITVPISGLVAGGSTTFTVKDIVRHQVGDTIVVNVMVDPENVIQEADESNNTSNTNVTIATNGILYDGGRFSSGVDLVNTNVYAEGNIGVRLLVYGSYHWFEGSGTATWTASDLNIPEGATLISARIYQAITWYGYPDFTLQFNGHDTQQPIGYYWDNIAGQNVFDVAEYFNLYGNNTAIITGGQRPYGAILVVIYEAASEPYRQIWINEGADCILGGSGDINGTCVAWTTFGNVSTTNIVSAQVTTVLLSGGEDGYPVYFNEETIPLSGEIDGDPGIHFHDVTNALQNGTNELGVPHTGTYFNFAIGVLEITHDLTAPTVSASIGTGVFGDSQTVTLNATDNLDTNPKIYYTLDGTDPTSSTGTLYTASIPVNVTTTLKFIAADDAGNVSDVHTETYTIDKESPTTSASIGTGVFGGSQNVTLTATDNVDTNPTIYYTTDGTTPTTNSTLYSGPITIAANTVLKFIAVDSVGNISPVQSRTYIIDTAAPTASANQAGGVYNNLSVIFKAEDNIDAHPQIYYTLNGDTPTTSSSLYNGAISINSSTTIRFIAVDIFGNTSPVQSETYTIDTLTPTINCNLQGNLFKSAQTVTLSATDDQCSTPKIYYTLNGEEPNTNCTLYTGPISINETTTLKFIAVDDAGNISPAQTEIYTIDTTRPTITSADPKNGANNIATGKTIKVTFSEDIKKGHMWIELLNSKLKAIPFTATISGKVLTVDPDSNLAESLYTLWIHTGAVTDQAGNPVAVRSTKFSAGTPPTITSVNPANNKVINVANKAIVITFSENIKAGSAFSSIKVTNPDGVRVNPLYKVINGKTLTLTRNGYYINRLTYTITLPKGSITDTAGNTINTYTSKFKIDFVKPKITGTNPTNNKVINVANKAIVITFSENIKAGSAFTSIKVTNPDGVRVNPLYKVINGKTLTLTRNGNYINGLTYTITLPTGSITDTAGNTINTYTSKFKVDTTKPTITRTKPKSNSSGYSLTAPITITFNENILEGINWSRITMKNLNTGKTVSFTKTKNSKTLTIKMTYSRLHKNTYQIYIPAEAVKDSTGNKQTTPYTITFKTQ